MIKKLFTEAGFGSNLIKGLNLVVNQLNKRTGNNYKLSEITEPYENNLGSFSGYNMLGGNKRLRFNIVLGDKTSKIYSVDIWNSIKELPDITLLFNEYNILQVLDEIVDYINGNVREAGRKTTFVKSSKQRRIRTKREKLMEKYGITDISASEKIKQLQSYIKLVAKGYKNSFVISGEPGLSKTTTVEDTIKNAGVKYAWANVFIGTVNDLYKILYNDNNKILVFDDTDYLIHKTRGKKFKDMLLAATDLNKKRVLQLKDVKDKEIQSINNPKGKYPQKFIYTGQTIFITNLDLKYIDPSLLSRSLEINIKFTNEEVIELIKKNLDKYYKEVSITVKEEVLDFIIDIIGIVDRFDFRKYRDVLMLRLSGDPNWKKWAFSML